MGLEVVDHKTSSRPRYAGVLRVPTKAGSERPEREERAVEIARHEVELTRLWQEIRIASN